MEERPRSRRLACRVVDVERAAPSVRILRLKPLDGARLPFLAGQYATLGFPGMEPRDYSMAGLPGEPLLEFHVRAVPGGGVSRRIAGEARPGTPVVLEGPKGLAHLRAAHRGPILCVGGGTGLAPMLSIAGAALRDDPRRSVRLVFGVRTEEELYALDRLDALARAHSGFRATVAVAEGPTEQRPGLPTDALAGLGRLDGWKAYLAGPPPMVEAAEALLREQGLAAGDIHADPFETMEERAARDAREAGE